jgi:hypothetical protein
MPDEQPGDRPRRGMGVKMTPWTTWRTSSRPGVTTGSLWLCRGFRVRMVRPGSGGRAAMAGCPAGRGHRPRCAAHRDGRGGNQAVGRAVAGNGRPRGQAPVWPHPRLGVRAARSRGGRLGGDRAVPATAPSTVTGAGAGLCLLVFGLATLLIGGRATAAANEPVPR